MSRIQNGFFAGKLHAARAVLLCLPLSFAVAAPSQQPGRVIGIGGDVTEIIYALSAQDRLVACDTSSIYPAETEKLPKVGYMRSVAAEGILALKPDLVIANALSGPPTALQQVRSVGVPVASIEAAPDIHSVPTKIRQVARALGLEERGETLAQVYSAQLSAAESNRLAYAPRAMFILNHAGGAQVAGRDTAADTILRGSGARNVLTDFSGYKPMSGEAIIAADPDVIMLTEQGLAQAGGIDGVLRMPGVAATRAGRERRIIAQDALLMLGVGLRTPQLLTTLQEQWRQIPAPAAKAAR